MGRYASGSQSRGSSIVLAPYNATASVKRGADHISAGADDQNDVLNAIADLPAQGGQIKLMPGKFRFSAKVTLKSDYIHIAGEGFGFWDSYVPGACPEGVGFVVIEMTAADHAFHIAERDGALGRPDGIVLERLYLYGHDKTVDKCGIYSNTYVDQPILSQLFVHNFKNGILGMHDAAHLMDCAVMDCGAGYGILMGGGWYGSMRGCSVGDNAGVGVKITTENMSVGLNQIYRNELGGLEFGVAHEASFVGNIIKHNGVFQVFGDTTQGASIIGGTISTSRADAYGIRLLTCTDCTLQGVPIRQRDVANAKVGIKVEGGGYCSVIGNIVSGAWTAPGIDIAGALGHVNEHNIVHA